MLTTETSVRCSHGVEMSLVLEQEVEGDTLILRVKHATCAHCIGSAKAGHLAHEGNWQHGRRN